MIYGDPMKHVSADEMSRRFRCNADWLDSQNAYDPTLGPDRAFDGVADEVVDILGFAPDADRDRLAGVALRCSFRMGLAEGRRVAPVPPRAEVSPGKPPPRHEVRFHPGYDDTHVEVRDAWLRVVAAGRGSMSVSLPPGLYEFTFTPNTRFEQPVSELVSVDRDMEASPGAHRPLRGAVYPWPPPA